MIGSGPFGKEGEKKRKRITTAWCAATKCHRTPTKEIFAGRHPSSAEWQPSQIHPNTEALTSTSGFCPIEETDPSPIRQYNRITRYSVVTQKYCGDACGIGAVEGEGVQMVRRVFHCADDAPSPQYF
ncbi:hypothetical protein [Bifidobacterium vansinderenii]|uniref:hypothetical protein n=1 Tax=Bifidobacterium vansinderenii TaxID=1984871 RepID=UPI001177C9EE|nr:hypothetical protein [Bifidobacterium vansinderenii]